MKKKEKKLIPKNWKPKEMLIGGAIGIFSIMFVFSAIPLTSLQIGSIFGELVADTTTTGSRLFLFGEHIHHYVFGILAVGVAFAIKKRNYAPYLFGFGAILFLDQLPYVLGLREFGI